MSIILFAIIGTAIEAGPLYWLSFYLLCGWKFIKFLAN